MDLRLVSHAAVVARGMGRPCVSGASALSIDMTRRVAKIAGREIAEGQILLPQTIVAVVLDGVSRKAS